MNTFKLYENTVLLKKNCVKFFQIKKKKLIKKNSFKKLTSDEKKKNTKIYGKFFQKKSKINFCSPYFWKKIFLFQQNRVFKYSEKKIFSRFSVIPLGFLKQFVEIHSGKKWYGRVINKWNVGFKFGELTWNRRIALYKAKQLKKKKKSSK